MIVLNFLFWITLFFIFGNVLTISSFDGCTGQDVCQVHEDDIIVILSVELRSDDDHVRIESDIDTSRFDKQMTTDKICQTVYSTKYLDASLV